MIKLDAQVADTPVGKPFAPETPSFEIPVANVVLCVMLGKTVLMHKVGVDDAVPASPCTGTNSPVERRMGGQEENPVKLIMAN